MAYLPGNIFTLPHLKKISKLLPGVSPVYLEGAEQLPIMRGAIPLRASGHQIEDQGVVDAKRGAAHRVAG